MADTFTVHEEVVRVGFDDAAALAQLARLQALADALFDKLQGGGSGGAGPSGSGGTTPSGSLGNSGNGGGGNGPPSGGGGTGGNSGGGQGGNGGSTTSSGNLPQPPPTPPSPPNPPGTPPPPPPTAPSGYGGSQMGQGANNIGTSAVQNAGNAVASGSMQGVANATSNFAGAVIGGGIASTVIKAVVAASGLETLDENTRTRSRYEKEYGAVTRDGFMPRSYMDWGGDQQAETPFSSRGKYKQRTLYGNSDLDWFLQAASLQGMEGDEALGAASAYTRAAGGRTGGDGNILRAMNAGVDPATMGGIDRFWALDRARGDANSGLRLASVGQQGFGMYGGLNEWLQKLTGEFDRLIDSGLKVDLNSAAEVFERMAGAGFSGRQAADVYRGLGNAASGAHDQLLSPFKGLTQKAALMKAISAGGGIEDWLRASERSMLNPDDLAEGSVGIFGERIAGLGFTADMPSLGVDGGRRLARGLPKGQRYELEGQDPGSLERSKIIAARRARDVTQPDRFYSKMDQGRVSRQTEKLVETTTDIGNTLTEMKEGFLQFLKDGPAVFKNWVNNGFF